MSDADGPLTSTCLGCALEGVALVDGHFCGVCTGNIASAIDEALYEELPAVDASVHDVGVGGDGFLHVRLELDEVYPHVTEGDDNDK